MVVTRGSASKAYWLCPSVRLPKRPSHPQRLPPAPPRSLTKQVSAGDAPLRDGGFHGTDGGGEDVGLLEDLGQLRTVQGAEGGGIVLLSALVELQHSQLVAPGLGIPVLVLQREEGQRGAQLLVQLGRGNYMGRHLSDWLHAHEGKKSPSTPVFFLANKFTSFQSSYL